MHSGLGIAVAELSLQKRFFNQSLEGYGFQERVVLRRYCLPLSSADVLCFAELLPNKIQG